VRSRSTNDDPQTTNSILDIETIAPRWTDDDKFPPPPFHQMVEFGHIILDKHYRVMHVSTMSRDEQERVRSVMHAREILDTSAPGYDWLADRIYDPEAGTGYLGCSEIAAALGLSNYQTPVGLWAVKTGVAKGDPGDPITRHGDAIEVYLCQEFRISEGYKVERPKILFGHPTIDHLRTNLDGWIPELDCHLECKDSNWRARKDWKFLEANGVPIDGSDVAAHYIQVQAAMSVLGTQRAWFAVDVAKELLFFPVERNEAWIKVIEDAAIGFWAAHIVTGEPPQMQMRDLKLMRQRYMDSHDKTVDISDRRDFGQLLEALDEANDRIRLATGTAGSLKEQMETMMRESGATQASFDGRNIGFRKGAKRLDGKALKAAHPEIAREFTKAGAPSFKINQPRKIYEVKR